MTGARGKTAARTIGAARRYGRLALQASATADLDAETLLAQVLGVERAFLFARPERALSDRQLGQYETALNRRAAGEPLAYILGRKAFYDLELLVTPAVLIPRPETELLLEEALRLTKDQPEATVADIGTGSGALAIGFARRRPNALVYASDVCDQALAIARANAERHGLRHRFLQGDLALPLIKRGLRVDLLMANLPYIDSDELQALAVSRYEPRLALDGGAGGLELIGRLLTQIRAVCRPGAWALLEIGADQGAAVAELVRDRLAIEPAILPDYAGLDRIARFRI